MVVSVPKPPGRFLHFPPHGPTCSFLFGKKPFTPALEGGAGGLFSDGGVFRGGGGGGGGDRGGARLFCLIGQRGGAGGLLAIGFFFLKTGSWGRAPGGGTGSRGPGGSAAKGKRRGDVLGLINVRPIAFGADGT